MNTQPSHVPVHMPTSLLTRSATATNVSQISALPVDESPSKYLAIEYRNLLSISNEIIHTQPVLERGIARASGGIPKVWVDTKQRLAQLCNATYVVPDVLDIVQLQRRQVHNYNTCLDTMIWLLDSQMNSIRIEQQRAQETAVQLSQTPYSQLSDYANRISQNASNRLEITSQTLREVTMVLCKYKLAGADYKSLLEHTIEPMVAMGLCANRARLLQSHMHSIHRFTNILHREFSVEMRSLQERIVSF